jgi:membrane-bound lytic murein transglycosylase MltF
VTLLSQYDWPVQQALDVSWCESHWNTNAQNASSATGLFQIIGGNPAMFDPAANVAAAYSKYLDGVSRGNPWWHWNQFGSCGHF